MNLVPRLLACRGWLLKITYIFISHIVSNLLYNFIYVFFLCFEEFYVVPVCIVPQVAVHISFYTHVLGHQDSDCQI